MKKLIAIIVSSVAICGYSSQFSKLSIITSAKSIGKWDSLKAWIASAGLSDEFQNCSYLSDDYPQYSALTNAIVSCGILTHTELKTILDNSIDSAVPDAMLKLAVSNDCLTASGRERWHGKVVSSIIDTNTLVRTQTHADGFVYVESFSSARPNSIWGQLSAAERQRQREKAARDLAARKELQRQERIALLTTNMSSEVAHLMNRNQWPEELARLMLQVELNKLIGTNIINSIVTP